MKQNCGTCAAWLKTNGEQGECHFAPPSPVLLGIRPPALQGGQPQPMIAGVFPATGAASFCRQWSQALADVLVDTRAQLGLSAPTKYKKHVEYKDASGVWKCLNCGASGTDMDKGECK